MNEQLHQLRHYFDEGCKLLNSGNSFSALVCFENALNLDQTNALVLLHIGAALHDLKRYDEAILIYRQAINIAPNNGEAYNNLGNSLMALGRFAEASDSYFISAEFLPTSPVPLTARATALQAIGQIAEAEAECRKAVSLSPSFAAAHWNLALNLLLQGNFTEGWQEYEWRWQKPDFTSPVRHNDVQLWDGSPLAGRTILLHAEQGFGDAIQFVRYATLVAQCGGTVIVECHSQLVQLFKAVRGVQKAIPFGNTLPEPFCQMPFLSLPRIFGTNMENIPSQSPYLSAPAEYRVKWEKLVPATPGSLKAGVVWAGKNYPDPLRSCRLEELVPLAASRNMTFYSLQVGTGTEQIRQVSNDFPIVDVTEHIQNFSDTAALIEQLDMVISIDTAVAHLAAALGKTVYLMLPFAPDWRWLQNRHDSPWYPSIRIFRQNQPSAWSDVIVQVKRALESNAKQQKIP